MTNILHAIETRRSVKPDRFTGEVIPDEAIAKAIEAANWAPNHGNTEPWRFVVFAGEKKNELLNFLNSLDNQRNGENPVRNEKRARSFEKISHVIAIVMKRGENPKIPEIEELLATGMAVQNFWLAAQELGFAGYWSTGAIAFDHALRDFLGFGPDDRSLGFFFAGICRIELPEGRRFSSGVDKTRWW